MRRVLILPFLVPLLFSSCSPAPAAVPTLTPSPSKTITPTIFLTRTSIPTATRTPTPAPTSTSTPSLTPTPAVIDNYPVKTVLLRYGYFYGCCSIFDSAFHSGFVPWIIIFTDGQMLIKQNGLMMQKKLSKSEIGNLLSHLAKLGFYQIKTEGHNHDETNPIYHFNPGEYQKVYDAPYYVIAVNGDNPKSIWVYEPYLQNVIQPVKNILAYLRSYTSTNLSLFHPDRLLLFIHGNREDPEYQKQAAIPWPSGLPPLADYNGEFLLLKDKEAATIYRLTQGSQELPVFSDQGKEYTVYTEVIYPYECPKLLSVTEEDIRNYYGNRISFRCEE